MENIIDSIERWNEFKNDNPLFVVGITDSRCSPECCESEPFLEILEKDFAANTLTYPSENGRTQIKIARMDLKNEELFANLGADQSMISDKVSILIVKNGNLQKY